MFESTKKSCGNCANCEKIHVGKPDEFWCCDVYGFYHFGVPANCSPPYDEPCEHYSETEKIDVDRLMEMFGF